ncbi:MAG TPA: hypothetical protein VGE67_08965 [Haloferula sp.]
MKLLHTLCCILGMMACSSMSVRAEAKERPGQVASVKDLKPYLLLLDGADLSLDGSGNTAGFLPTEDADLTKMRTLLLKEGTFQPWTEKKSRANFKEEHTISWHGEQRSINVSLSPVSNEALVEITEDPKKLRYELNEDTKWEMVKLLTDRKNAARALIESHKETARAKANPVERTDAWRKPIAEGAVLTVHEGLPHRGDQTYLRESRRNDVQILAGHAFYTPGVAAKHRAELAKLLADSSSFHRHSGAKECGGFHPDFAVTWRINRQTITLQLCYSCYEVCFSDGKTSLIYDLDHEAGKKIEPLLKENGGKRPAQ